MASKGGFSILLILGFKPTFPVARWGTAPYLASTLKSVGTVKHTSFFLSKGAIFTSPGSSIDSKSRSSPGHSNHFYSPNESIAAELHSFLMKYLLPLLSSEHIRVYALIVFPPLVSCQLTTHFNLPFKTTL